MSWMLRETVKEKKQICSDAVISTKCPRAFRPRNELHTRGSDSPRFCHVFFLTPCVDHSSACFKRCLNLIGHRSAHTRAPHLTRPSIRKDVNLTIVISWPYDTTPGGPLISHRLLSTVYGFSKRFVRETTFECVLIVGLSAQRSG